MSDSQDILDRAYTILRDRGICRDAYANDAQGNPVPTADPTATTFCGMGAIYRAWIELGGSPDDLEQATATLTCALHEHFQVKDGYPTWHDRDATNKDILDLFRAVGSPTLVAA
jgi:hypothetical protein